MRFLETQLYSKQKYQCDSKEDRAECKNNRKNYVLNIYVF